MRFCCLPPTLVLAAGLALSLPVAAAESTSNPLTDKASAMLVRLGLLYRPPVAESPAAPAPAVAPEPAPEPASASIERVPPPPPDAYERLQQHGLLDAPPAPAPVMGEPADVTSTAVAAPESAQAYSVLQRLGLLDARPASAPPAPVAPPATPDPVSPADAPQVAKAVPVPSSDALPDAAPADALPPAATVASAPASLAASAVEKPAEVTRALSDPLSRAYELLRAKGLLPGGPVNPVAKAHPPRRNDGAERVLVDKSERKLFLYKGGRPYREYRISLGGMPVGPKQRAGDLRTPEGVYTLDWRNPRSRYYKAIHISYPNEQDRQRAAEQGVDPGGAIMIHGEHYLPSLRRTLRRSPTPKDWTEGCIAMNNEHIDEIWREVADGTPIEIRP